ncbi:hypothetical protein B0H13DRAFT_1589462 [Mycena leptocephala]|nr:hypothetical protein B0H13DRAFT_1589462 [Mycena leptocephala]
MSFRVVLNSIIRYSVLPAIPLDGVVHLDVIPGSYNAAALNSFIDGLLDNMSPVLSSNPCPPRASARRDPVQRQRQERSESLVNLVQPCENGVYGLKVLEKATIPTF